MGNETFEKDIRHAVDARLAGMAGRPDRRERVLRQAKGEIKVKRKLSTGLVIALAFVAVAVAALAMELPHLNDLLTPAGQDAPPFAATAEPAGIIPTVQDTFLVDSLADVYGYDMSHLTTLIDYNPTYQSIQSAYAHMVADQALWDGEHLYLSVNVTPKENYYLVDFYADAEIRAAQEASANAENRQIIYPVISCDEPGDSTRKLSVVYDAGSIRYCVMIQAPCDDYGTSEGLLVCLKLKLHLSTAEETKYLDYVSPDSCAYVLFSVTMKGVPLLYYGAEYSKARYYNASNNNTASPFESVSVRVTSTLVATRVEYYYRLSGIKPEDSSYVNLQWLDESGEPYPLPKKESLVGSPGFGYSGGSYGTANKTVIYEGRASIPETMILRFVDLNTGKEIDTFTLDVRDERDYYAEIIYY